jgi:DNA recombination protein RmuC
MIVKMPNQRELVVDVKTPLDSYLQAIEAKEISKKEFFLKKHAQNVREHIRKLSRKSYWKQFARSPEFVILFIPGDQFLSAALNEDPDLIDSALSQQIILATPTSLIALLKAIAYGWKQQALSGNAEQIRELAEALYDRLITFISHLNKLGKQLSSSVEHYNKAIGSFERKVLPGARKFSELGVGSKKEIEEIKSIELPTRKLRNDLKKTQKSKKQQ